MKRALLALLLAACGGHASAPAPAPSAPANPKACTADDDCALVDACCGCAQGGKRISIRKDAVASHEAQRSKMCAGEQCKRPDEALPHSSCDAEPVCRDGRCAVQAHLGGH